MLVHALLMEYIKKFRILVPVNVCDACKLVITALNQDLDAFIHRVYPLDVRNP